MRGRVHGGTAESLRGAAGDWTTAGSLRIVYSTPGGLQLCQCNVCDCVMKSLYNTVRIMTVVLVQWVIVADGGCSLWVYACVQVSHVDDGTLVKLQCDKGGSVFTSTTFSTL